MRGGFSFVLHRGALIGHVCLLVGWLVGGISCIAVYEHNGSFALTAVI